MTVIDLQAQRRHEGLLTIARSRRNIARQWRPAVPIVDDNIRAENQRRLVVILPQVLRDRSRPLARRSSPRPPENQPRLSILTRIQPVAQTIRILDRQC